jgi:hypothetical protein
MLIITNTLKVNNIKAIRNNVEIFLINNNPR